MNEEKKEKKNAGKRKKFLGAKGVWCEIVRAKRWKALTK